MSDLAGGAGLRLSVVIPTYDRPQRLAACLEALARQQLPREHFEVIVVDDGSPAPAESALAAVQGRLDATLLRQPRLGPARARNAGAERARGALLVFTDDDCQPHTDWLSALAAAAEQAPGAGLGGSTRNALADNVYSATSQLLVDHLYESFNPEPSDARFFTSNNLALPTGEFRRLGGFAESFVLPAGEDRELCDRWRHAGLRLVFAPDARVEHFHALDFVGFAQQHFRYGRGAHEYRRVCRTRGTVVRFEGVGFYLRLLARPFASEPPLRALGMLGLLLISQGMNAAGFFWQAAQEAVRRRSRQRRS